MVLPQADQHTNNQPPHTCLTRRPQIIQQVLQESGHDPAIAALVCGTGAEVGEKLVADPRVELVSFTGSTKVRSSAVWTERKRRSVLT